MVIYRWPNCVINEENQCLAAVSKHNNKNKHQYPFGYNVIYAARKLIMIHDYDITNNRADKRSLIDTADWITRNQMQSIK